MTEQAVAERAEQMPAEHQPQSEASSLMQVISRAASDPSVDMDKFERLMAMQERREALQAKIAFDGDLAEMQAELPVVERKGKIVVRKKDNAGERNGEIQQSTPYALWEDINEAIKPVMRAHGFALSFRTGTTAEGRITITGILSHKAGHREETTLALMHDSSGSKNSVQAVGSSISYGKRYVAGMLINLTSRGEDDDGKLAGADETISDEQFEQLRKLMDDADADIEKFCIAYSIDAVKDLPAAKFETAISQMKQKIARKGVA